MQRFAEVFGCSITPTLVLTSALVTSGGDPGDMPAGSSAQEESPTAHEAIAVRPETDAKQYVGAERCAECHQAEYGVWAATAHASSVYDLLRTSPNAQRYATNLGLDADHVAHIPRCLACHSTPQDEVTLQTGAVSGVTCEACHNAAGGMDGWLNRHGVYGLSGTRREDEAAEHRKQRIAACRTAGQIRSDDLYQLARRCYACHVVGDEELIVRGGHSPGNPGFEMVAWFGRDLRHNLFLNPQRNALVSSLWSDPLWRNDQKTGSQINRRRVMYVVALLVDLELSLHHRGRAAQISFATSAASRIAAAHIRLKALAVGDSPPVLSTVVEQVDHLSPRLFKQPAPDDFQAFEDAVSLVGRAARQIAAADDGKQLAAVDPFLPTESGTQGARLSEKR